eukprot:SM000091S24634  [mRNA]  locus=s91:451873:454596:+ [translate_table: standard]
MDGIHGARRRLLCTWSSVVEEGVIEVVETVALIKEPQLRVEAYGAERGVRKQRQEALLGDAVCGARRGGVAARVTEVSLAQRRQAQQPRQDGVGEHGVGVLQPQALEAVQAHEAPPQRALVLHVQRRLAEVQRAQRRELGQESWARPHGPGERQRCDRRAAVEGTAGEGPGLEAHQCRHGNGLQCGELAEVPQGLDSQRRLNRDAPQCRAQHPERLDWAALATVRSHVRARTGAGVDAEVRQAEPDGEAAQATVGGACGQPNAEALQPRAALGQPCEVVVVQVGRQLQWWMGGEGVTNPLCNAHTTGVDVLWAGLPMITLPLQKMATRVAMSLAFACGLGPEMVVYSLDEYEERAVMYATNPELLKALRGKLSRNRFTCPLFDTARWVVNFERALFAMWKLYCRGRHPSPFKILEDDRAFPLHGSNKDEAKERSQRKGRIHKELAAEMQSGHSASQLRVGRIQTRRSKLGKGSGYCNQWCMGRWCVIQEHNEQQSPASAQGRASGVDRQADITMIAR